MSQLRVNTVNASTPYTLFPGCTFKTYEKRSQHENWETIS